MATQTEPLLPRIQKIVKDAKLDGWLFYDFRGLNPIALSILGVPNTLSRRWFLFVPAKGTPKLLVSRIEAGTWSRLLASEKLERSVFSAHQELDAWLAGSLKSGASIAMEYSPRGAVPYVGKVDAGTLERVRETGINVVSSADMVQQFLVWDDEDRIAHGRAVAGVIAAKDTAFALIHQRLLNQEPIGELEVQDVISAELRAHNLEFDHAAIVGFAGHAGDPHYAPNQAENRTLEPGMCVLLDIWGGEPNRPMADITWMGFAGEPSTEFLKVWQAVKDARDTALKLLTSKTKLQGWQVDRAARDVIEKAGFGAHFTHRLGHSLGRNKAHGDGANLDDLETHDERLLLAGTAVTVEPGAYFEHLGVRSEVNLLLTPKGAIVTTPVQQAPYVLGLPAGIVEHGTEIKLELPAPAPAPKKKIVAAPTAASKPSQAQASQTKPTSKKTPTGPSQFSVSSYGAARTVTGSNHLLEMAGKQIMLDCGVFQGSKYLEGLNQQPFGFSIGALDAVVLSHAHQDHTGRLPKLVKEGYSGPIYATAATKELCECLLLDSAKLQQEDFERNQRKGREAHPPLFNEEDVAKTLKLFETIEYNKALQIGEVRLNAQIAGHIPGSTSLLFESSQGRFVFSGDLGNARKDVLPDPVLCPDADLVLMESTYGDRDHRPFEQTLEEFAKLLSEASQTGGKILIPSFALERTQDVLYHIARLEEQRVIPPLPVFVDSPLATKVEKVYSGFQREFDKNVRAFYVKGRDPFSPSRLKYTQSTDESKQLNDMAGAAVIIAGSGMMAGGRIMHHLLNHLSKPDTTVMIVGYQPEGGLGRLLVDGEPSVKIMGEQVRVRARICTVNGFSAHADRSELLKWSAGVSGEVRLVHGEIPSMESLQSALQARGQRSSIQEPTGYTPTPSHRDEGNE